MAMEVTVIEVSCRLSIMNTELAYSPTLFLTCLVVSFTDSCEGVLCVSVFTLGAPLTHFLAVDQNSDFLSHVCFFLRIKRNCFLSPFLLESSDGCFCSPQRGERDTEMKMLHLQMV
jgi:hypothetical protein